MFALNDKLLKRILHFPEVLVLTVVCFLIFFFSHFMKYSKVLIKLFRKLLQVLTELTIKKCKELKCVIQLHLL